MIKQFEVASNAWAGTPVLSWWFVASGSVLMNGVVCWSEHFTLPLPLVTELLPPTGAADWLCLFVATFSGNPLTLSCFQLMITGRQDSALRTIPSIWTMKPPPTSSENANACVLFDSLLENDPNKSLKRKSTPGWKAVFHTEHYCMLCYTSTAHRVLENTAGSLQQSEQLHHLRWVKTRILRGCI